MIPANEALLSAFYLHKIHVEDSCLNEQFAEGGMENLCNDLFSILLETECHDIIDMIRKLEFTFNIGTSDIPQFSNLMDSIFKVPVLVRDCGIEDLSFTQLGFMLRVKPRKEGADFKYGENHAKTAAQMGLCSIVKSKIYSSYLGLAFNKLDIKTKEQIYPKLILFVPYIFNLYATSADYDSINKSVSILADSTQQRRLTNIWTLINHVNSQLPYELQIIRY